MCGKKLKIHCKGCNAMYVKGVKRDSKYTMTAHNIFAHNFLSIQTIFNLKEALESFPTIPSNDMYVEAC